MRGSQSEERRPEDPGELSSRAAQQYDLTSKSFYGSKPAAWAPRVGLAEALERARAEYTLGHYDSALRTLETVLPEATAALGQKEGAAAALSTLRLMASASALQARTAARLGLAERQDQAVQQALPAFERLRASGATLSGEELADYAIVLYLAGQVEAAAEVMDEAAARGGATPERYVYAGLIEYRRGNLQEAVAALEQAELVKSGDLQQLRLETLAAALEGLGPERAFDAAGACFALADFHESAGRHAEAMAASERALVNLERSLAANPADFAALAAQGQALWVLRRYEEAADALAAALRLQPDFPEALALRGDALRLLGRHAEAFADLDKSLALRPGDAWTLARRGEVLRMLGRYAEALADFEQALALNPQDDFALSSKGDALRMLDRYDEALAALDASLAIRPDYAWALSAKGEVLRLLGRHEEALAALNRALELAPDDAQTLARRGEVLRLLGRHEEAFADLDKSLALRPEHAWTLARRGEVLRMLERYEEALVDFEHALALNPQDDFALSSKGDALRMLGRYDEALAALDASLAIRPDYAWALSSKGETLRLLGRHEEALAALNRALELAPDDAQALARRGNVLLLLGRFEEALADLDESLALQPEDAWTLARRGEVLRMLGRFEEALTEFDKALAQTPDDIFALSSKGEALRMLGRPAEAEELQRRVLERDPQNLFAQAALGYALLDQGREQEASGVFRQALSQDPNFAWPIEGLVLALVRLDDVDEGLVMTRRLLEIAPQAAQAHALAGALLYLGADYQGAADKLEQAVALDAGLAWAQNLLGDCCFRLSRTTSPQEARLLLERGLAAVQQAVALNPEDSTWRVTLAEMLQRQGDAGRSQAWPEYLRVLEAGRGKERLDFSEARDVGWAAFHLAAYDEAEGEALLTEAERFLVEALALKKERLSSSDAIEVKFRLALVILVAGQFALALREYDGALRLTRERQPALQRGLLDRARTDLHEALHDWPRLVQTRYAYRAREMLDKGLAAVL